MSNIHNNYGISPQSPNEPDGLFIKKKEDKTLKKDLEKTEQENIESVKNQQLSKIKQENDPSKAVDEIAFTGTQSVQSPELDNISRMKKRILQQETPKLQEKNYLQEKTDLQSVLKQQIKRTLLNQKPIRNLNENIDPTKPIGAPLPKEVTEAVNSELEKLTNLTKEEKIITNKRLSDTYQNTLPSPKKNYTNTTVLVWRGLNAKQLVSMAAHNSAGGVTANSGISKPSKEEVINQVGERGSLPEFTYDEKTAIGFGTNNYVAVFEINKAYLEQGSIVENGVICKKEAPVELLAWTKGRSL